MRNPASLISYDFVLRGIKQGLPITQMKLQKMLYFGQGIHLVKHKGEPLVKEQFQAWKYGPVIPTIYSTYKFYGKEPITDTYWLDKQDKIEEEVKKIDRESKLTIDLTWTTLKNIDAIKLSNWTHSKDSPWFRYYKEGGTDIVIPNEEIENYFQKFFVKEANVA